MELTYSQMHCIPPLLKVNTPIVSATRVLPMVPKKGIITLTLVISRESARPPVTRWFCVMFNILRTKVKTKLEMQVEEYVEYKARTSPFIAEDQKIILEGFIKEINRTNISEITLQELDAYYLKISVGQTNWRTVNITKAIRAFIRFHKRYTTIKPRQITDMGIKQIKPSLQSVAENAIIEPMTKRKKVGRPPNVAFIKEIKRLVDKGGLGIREIARAKLINPGNVSRAYNYDLSKII